ncbi:hypothetical protein TNCV_4650531 [Trichonephila clavipes]|nr:hypothetical protein TNCV_4650531 [Trichonephila clavipes]
MDHVILNYGQVTWTTPELARLSPNYHTPPTGVGSLERLFGVGALGKPNSDERFCIVRAQVPPSGKENGQQNLPAKILLPTMWCHTEKDIPPPGECTRSAMV